jgi:hypothetical protein
MAKYTIENSHGERGGMWSCDYDTLEAAKVGLRQAMGWGEIVLSHAYTHDADDNTAWSAYETQEDCDADDEGAHAPCIVRDDAADRRETRESLRRTAE